MKTHIYNPANGAPIKNWWDGTSRWNLGVDEVAGFPQDVGKRLLETYQFLVEVSVDEFESRLAKLEKEEPTKIKVNPEGQLVPKSEEEVEAEREVIEKKKESVKAAKEKVKKAKDAEPATPNYWELPRGDLIAECDRRNIEVKGLGKKGVYVTKEQLINLLENDDR